tara:strand:+ start:75 stop:680 length:606 start_codon:yes stop_codon:yes gene_type:complete
MKNLLLFLILLACTNLVQSQTMGTMTDPRDGQTYKTVTYNIDGKSITWMAENLNYEINNSYAYDNDKNNREKYGLMYSREAVKNACPNQWRLPSRKEGQALTDAFDTSEPTFLNKDKNVDNNRINRNAFNVLFGGVNGPNGFSQIGKMTSFYQSEDQVNFNRALIIIREALPTGGWSEEFIIQNNTNSALIKASYCRCVKN